MMFLQYALWGAWLPVTARYLSASVSDGGLGFTGSQIGMILGLAGSIGAIAAPFIAGAEVPNVTARLVDALKFSGGISILYGAFCFLLPNTPPKRDATDKLAFKKAFELFQHSSFTILVISSLTVSIIHQIYFLQTGPFLSYIGIPDSQIGPAMTIGQFAEY